MLSNIISNTSYQMRSRNINIDSITLKEYYNNHLFILLLSVIYQITKNRGNIYSFINTHRNTIDRWTLDIPK